MGSFIHDARDHSPVVEAVNRSAAYFSAALQEIIFYSTRLLAIPKERTTTYKRLSLLTP